MYIIYPLFLEYDNLPQIPMSPQEKVRPIISPKRAELSIADALKSGSAMLREEASFNLQKFGGNFMPDFYGGKARMDFGYKNGLEDLVRLYPFLHNF